ncbi:MAG TPA: RNA polymerase sigma factor [Acidimicrobiia bacterium]
MNDPGIDAEVIEGSLQDPDLFAVIFQRHYRDVHRFVVAAVGASDGPDLAAEVFLRAFASRHRYRSSYPSARPWLWGIASNLIAGHYRSRARQNKAYRRVPPHPESEFDHSRETVNRVAAESDRPLLAEAMKHLRKEEAEVLMLFAIGDCSYAEIASVLGIAEGTVRSRLSRTRSKLRNLFDQIGESTSNDE